MTDVIPTAVTRAGLRRQIAIPQRDILVPVFGQLMRPTDDVLLSQGGGKGLKIYDEIERDPLAHSVLQKRKLGLVARAWELVPGGPRRQDKNAAKLAERLLNGDWGLSFDKVCLDLLDSTLKGFAVAETMWDLRDGWWVPVEIKPKDQRRFVFDVDSRPRMLTPEDPLFGEELPDLKFLVHRFGDKTGDPYGRGLGHQLFWWVYFKRMGTQFWLTFGEKFGSPTVIGEVPSSATPEEEDLFLAKLTALAQQTAMTVPEGAVVKFLEALRSGTVTYPDLVNYCDRMITVGVMGETLTTSEGSSGSRALGQVHQSVKDEIIDADADLLSATLNTQLLAWLTLLNFPDATPPRVWRPRPEEEGEKAKTDQEKLKARQMALSFVNDMRRSGWEPDDSMADVTDQAVGRWNYTGKASGVVVTPEPPTPEPPTPDLPAPEPTQPPPDLAAPGNDQAAMRDLVDHLDQAAGGALDALIGRVRAMLDRVDTLEEAQAALVEIYPQLATDDLALVVGRALALANLTGRLDIADGH